MVRIHPCPVPNAGVAQLVEQHLDMVEVVGSSPISRTPGKQKTPIPQQEIGVFRFFLLANHNNLR